MNVAVGAAFERGVAITNASKPASSAGANVALQLWCVPPGPDSQTSAPGAIPRA